MLRFLAIRNLAVIDRLELEFEPGLNVLTGETGAGKSILVGAVALLVGGRASVELVRTGEDHATVEAVFEGDAGREVVVRREISAQSGRSRSFVDGALATSTSLRDLAARLVDLHGQHDHQRLLDPSTHLDLLDAFGGLSSERSQVREAFTAWQHLKSERDRLASGAREQLQRTDFLEFQLDEVRRIAPRLGEDDELTALRQLLTNADRLQRLCAEAYAFLYDGDSAALASLGTVWKKVSDLAAIDPQFEPYLGPRDAIKSQLEDLAYFLRSYSSSIDASPGRLQEVEDRLVALDRLKKKHGPTLDDVFAKAARMQQELDSLRQADTRGLEIEGQLDAARTAYSRAADALSARRRLAAGEFGRRLQQALGLLAMPRTQCEVRFQSNGGETGWTERGYEAGEFFISPNPGEDLRPLAKIVSGGELSRIMLALKTLASTDDPGKTLIFDEVDAGIGGAVADVVGGHLKTLGRQFQVLCITHLPQIAAYGTAHYRIAKSVEGTRTVTTVRHLSGRQREEEIARMIGGVEISSAVRASAREMLRRSAPDAEASGFGRSKVK